MDGEYIIHIYEYLPTLASSTYFCLGASPDSRHHPLPPMTDYIPIPKHVGSKSVTNCQQHPSLRRIIHPYIYIYIYIYTYIHNSHLCTFTQTADLTNWWVQGLGLSRVGIEVGTCLNSGSTTRYLLLSKR